ncbi:MAG: serine hydrolase domain-containing protein [Candidatus Latescibacterota bacterium]|nr:serine hydrolase domain-containing protein [Candidatus Latescibacterota bacterium]
MTELQKTTALLEAGIEAGLHPGAQVYVSRAGQPLADFAIGDASPGVPMTPGCLLPWLSAGKPLTAVAIMQLVDEGELGLDDPVVSHLPEFGHRGKDTVRVRHLLTHTAGFRCRVDMEEQACDWEHALQQIYQSSLERNWVPGERAGYQARSSWYVLGELVQSITGQELEAWLWERILKPLGLECTSLALDETKFAEYGDRIALMHDTRSGAAVAEDPFNTPESVGRCIPGSSARGPIRDLGRFYEAFLEGGRGVISAETVCAMTSRQRQGMHDESFNHIVDWGLGLLLDSNQYGADTVPYGYGRHASPRTYGHSGRRSSAGFADAEHGLAVAIAVNGRPAPDVHMVRFRELLSAVYVDLDITS